MQDLYNSFSVKFVVVGQVLRRYSKDSIDFNCKVGALHQYLEVLNYIFVVLCVRYDQLMSKLNQ